MFIFYNSPLKINIWTFFNKLGTFFWTFINVQFWNFVNNGEKHKICSHTWCYFWKFNNILKFSKLDIFLDIFILEMKKMPKFSKYLVTRYYITIILYGWIYFCYLNIFLEIIGNDILIGLIFRPLNIFRKDQTFLEKIRHF